MSILHDLITYAPSSSSFEIVAPLPVYAAAIQAARRKLRAACVINALRFLLKDRRYYIRVPGDATPMINIYSRAGASIPRTGIIRNGNPPSIYGVVQLLDIRHGQMAERVLTRFMSALELAGEVIHYRSGRGTYYHLIEGSPLDIAVLPPFTVVMNSISERDIDISNPFDVRADDVRCSTCAACTTCRHRRPDMRRGSRTTRIPSAPALLHAVNSPPLSSFSPHPDMSPLSPWSSMSPPSPLTLELITSSPIPIQTTEKNYNLYAIPELPDL